MSPKRKWAAAVALVAAVATRRAVAEEAGQDFLTQSAETLSFTLGTPQAVALAPRGDAVVFLRSGPRSFARDLFEFDPRTGRERVLATADGLLGGGEEKVTAEEQARRERQRLVARGIATFQLADDGSRVLVPLSGKLYVVERASGALRTLADEGGVPLDARFSPDGRRVACVREGDLYVIDLENGLQRRLTTGADATTTHGLAEFVAQEEMVRSEGFWWSPDSSLVAYEEADTRAVEVLHIADPMHPERPADAWPYPRPGHSNAETRLGVVAVGGGPTTWIEWDRARYPYLATVRWEKNAPLALLVKNREQTEEVLLAADPATGKTSVLLEEQDAAWLNLEQSVPKWLADGSAFLWLSERTGEARLELRRRDGTFDRFLTPAGFGLGQLLAIDSTTRAALVSASADPTQLHVFRVPLDGGTAEQLSTDPGMHRAVYARDGSASVWADSLATGERSFTVRDRTGRETGRLASVAEQPPFLPNLELTTIGARQVHAAIVRPRSFRAGKKYPVLLSAYTGPTIVVVQQQPLRYLIQQWQADHGFIVVSLDGRGTPGRGRDWERVIKGDLIDVQLEDQVQGLRDLAAKYPELDLDRVGVNGWSFGGYFAAMAAMRRPDVFKAAVAGAPVCDWRDYDTHYTERYLGLLERDPAAYDKSSVLTYAADLKVPLLVVHGTADDNVYFLHSLKMTNALFRAGRPYEFLVLPGFTHLVPEPVVVRSLQTRVIDFFRRELKP